jgi:hypothetical protein
MPTTQTKRLKEKNRQDRRRDKDARRDQRRLEKANVPARSQGEDPDIAGIIPGPQPPRED